MSCRAHPLPALMSEVFAVPSPTAPRAGHPPEWAALLARFYLRAGLQMPVMAQLQREEMPEPYRQLLVHSRDMTPTLETFHGHKLAITVLSREREQDAYLREVLLRPAPDPACAGETPAGAGRAPTLLPQQLPLPGPEPNSKALPMPDFAADRNVRAPVEYGVIRIFLDKLPPTARGAVLAEERPFGDILQTEGIGHLSWPQAFFRIEADFRLGRVLGVRPAVSLYGRRNVLVDGSRRLLAEVIEVLPPADHPEGRT
jgi:hypothetical protein